MIILDTNVLSEMMKEELHPLASVDDSIAAFNKLKGLGSFDLVRKQDPVEAVEFE